MAFASIFYLFLLFYMLFPFKSIFIHFELLVDSEFQVLVEEIWFD